MIAAELKMELWRAEELTGGSVGGMLRTTVADMQEPEREMCRLSSSSKQQVLRLRFPLVVRSLALPAIELHHQFTGTGESGAITYNSLPLQQSDLNIE